MNENDIGNWRWPEENAEHRSTGKKEREVLRHRTLSVLHLAGTVLLYANLRAGIIWFYFSLHTCYSLNVNCSSQAPMFELFLSWQYKLGWFWEIFKVEPSWKNWVRL